MSQHVNIHYRAHLLASKILKSVWSSQLLAALLIFLKNRKRKEVTLCIQDSAPGVKTEELNKLFERFYRVEKSRNREFGGSGLGLALCQQIVLAHNGDITLGHSELGGLKAKITLPLFE